MSADPTREPEFAEGASDSAGLTRLEFLRLMGASLALGGGVACTRQPAERIVPYMRQPEGLTPGEPQWYATALEHGPNSYGLLVKSHDGRPTKIEGNPAHPMSLGRTGVHGQAAVLDLYDPDRSQTVRHRGQPSTWEDFLGALTLEQVKWRASGGAGVRLLTGRSNSPLVHQQIAQFLQRYPKAAWYQHDAAFPLEAPAVRYDLEKADVIVSFDDDFLGPTAGNPRAMARFAQRRHPGVRMNRLYVFESMPSVTGTMADHRFAVGPGALQHAVYDLLQAIAAVPPKEPPAALGPLSRDLLDHRGRSLVLAGAHQPPGMQAAVAAMNRALGNAAEFVPTMMAAKDLASLRQEMLAGEVSTLLVLDANPIYTAPGEAPFPRLEGGFTMHSGLHFDETAATCDWHVPLSHFLESWSDTQALDGTRSIIQPLIEPLYPTKSLSELLGALLGETLNGYELLRRSWPVPEPSWRQTLHDGAQASPRDSSPGVDESISLTPPSDEELNVLIRPDPHLLDGRFANNAWLQELPRPITKLTWGNAIYLSPATAAAHQLAHGDEVRLQSGRRSLHGPVFLLPGHAENCATVHLGGGRTRAGRVGTGVGFDASILQTAESPWLCEGVAISRTGKRHEFATTQHQMDMAGRAPVVLSTGERGATTELDSLYPAVRYSSPSWGMVIDLNTCTGCGTCTIACQAENNIPVVGRAEVMRGRALHWIRVDHYIEGHERPLFLHQPVPCMHCENAPCEVVCPVAATVHDHQGLNLMVYNRCVGTRYCSNNCPYKVRRFNFFQYADQKTPQLKLQRNPEVTVRERGVMEKCTYCLQRISRAQIAADVEKRAIRDGEVVPACAQACPADAIAFGDILGETKVAAARRDSRHYALLEELNTRPRTTYLAKALNPNPEMAS